MNRVMDVLLFIRMAWTELGVMYWGALAITGKIQSPEEERREYEAELRRIWDDAERRALKKRKYKMYHKNDGG